MIPRFELVNILSDYSKTQLQRAWVKDVNSGINPLQIVMASRIILIVTENLWGEKLTQVHFRCIHSVQHEQLLWSQIDNIIGFVLIGGMQKNETPYLYIKRNGKAPLLRLSEDS